MKIENSNFLSLQQLQNQYLNTAAPQIEKKSGEGASFRNLLEQVSEREVGEVKFSKHAGNRLHDRNIELTTNQLSRLNEGARKAEAKGIRDSLVMVDELAFIVNIPSQTVITAMDQNETKDSVFTKIDGAVII